MKLFHNLREAYGQNVVKQVRQLEKLELNDARYRNHLVFTLRCRDSNIMPPSLRLKCPINTNNARTIVEKVRKQLVRKEFD